MNKSANIYIAGHRGMVGSAILDNLLENGYKNLITATSSELDLRNQESTQNFISKQNPDVVIVAAARVGGILANSKYPWQFIYDNLMMQANLVNASHQANVQDLIFLGSSCIYPKMAPQPLKEQYLLTGALESTNEWYAIAKISGIKMCQALNKQYGRNYISIMPTNLYGPRDNFDLKTSHVLPAMLRKFHDAKLNSHSTVTLWGSGSPMREFLHVEDLAEVVRFVMEYNNNMNFDLINAGTGIDLSIKELAETIQQVVGYKGEIVWDKTKPDGTPRKLMDVSRVNSMGWKSSIELLDGIKSTYSWYLDNMASIKHVEIES